MGGTQRPETNQVSACLHLCAACHYDIELFRRRALESGWLVSQVADPAGVTVLYQGRWVLLDDNGGIRAVSEAD